MSCSVTIRNLYARRRYAALAVERLDQRRAATWAALAQCEAELRALGIEVTPLRRNAVVIPLRRRDFRTALMRYVWASRGPFTAEEMAHRIIGGCGMDVTTILEREVRDRVRRHLRALEAQGVVGRICVGGSPHHLSKTAR